MFSYPLRWDPPGSSVAPFPGEIYFLIVKMTEDILGIPAWYMSRSKLIRLHKIWEYSDLEYDFHMMESSRVIGVNFDTITKCYLSTY